MTKTHPIFLLRHRTFLALALLGLLFSAMYVYAAFNPTVSLSANPTSSTPGAPVTLSWSATPPQNPDTGETPDCVGTGFSTGGARSGSVTVNPMVTTTYSVRCWGNITRTATVTISSNPPTASLSANPTSILYGNSTTLTWSSTNATFCSNIADQLTGDTYATNGATSGSLSVTPSPSVNQSRTYTINCSGSGGNASGQVTITTQHGVGAYLYLSPSTIQSGNSASLSWNSSYANSCTGTNFSTGGATSGSVSVSPTQTTTYTLTCSGNQGSSSSDSEVLGVNAPPIGVSCTVNPNPSNMNQSVTWVASAWGGVSPYSYAWVGELVDGLTGSSAQATYTTPGERNVMVEVTDSWSSTGGWYPTTYDNQRCTGTPVGGDSDTQDGGTSMNATTYAKAFARGLYNRPEVPPADFHTNPGNYCVEAHVGQPCDPSGTTFGSGACRFGVDATIYSGNGRRPVNSSDFHTVNGWQTDKYYGAIVYSQSQAQGGRTVSYQCPSLTVNANAPTATLTANPVSVTQGSASTLTWSSTNAASCSIDNGVGTVTPNTTGTSSVTPSVSTTYTLTCTGPGGTATSMATVSVTALQADLTAGAVSPGSATAGSPVTLSATITNGGNGPTNATFNDLFQRATDSSGSGATDIGTYASAALASGGSNTASRSYTFPSSGTWYVRACADKSSGGDTNGAITESNELNNCGPWTAITVSAASPPSSCTVDNPNPTLGVPVTYTANGGSAPYTWTPSGGSGSGSTGNTITRTYSVAGPYTMQVSANGSSAINCPVVTAGPVSCGTGTASITANPDRVRSGQTSNISWTATNVDSSCVISGPGVSQTTPASGTCAPVSGSASPSPTITVQSVYTISCDSGESTAQAVVNLIPRFIEF